MTNKFVNLRLTGAEILRDERIETGDISIADGMLSDGPANRDVALKDYLILPGIIDLHGDSFERHMAPRPTAPLPMRMGLLGTDRDAAVNGVTTAWMAQSWSWEGGHRSPDFAEQFLQAVEDYRPQMLTDLRVQIERPR